MVKARDPAEFARSAAPRPIGVGALAEELSEVVGVQLCASRRDIAQAQTILSDAIQRLLQCLPAAERAEARKKGGDALATTQRLSQALVNLQFQDLVSQLLRRADDRLAALDSLLQELARILSADDLAAVRIALERLGGQTLAPERRTSNSIQQVNMAPGDVELF